MRLLLIGLGNFRSVDSMLFEAGPFTVLFGKNNSGKTTLLKAIETGLSELESPAASGFPKGQMKVVKARPKAAFFSVKLDPGLPFDDAVAAAVGADSSFGDEIVVFAHTQSGFRLIPSEAMSSTLLGSGTFDLSAFPADGPSLRSLLLDWEIDEIDTRVVNAMDHLAEDTFYYRLEDTDHKAPIPLTALWGKVLWLESAGEGTFRVRPTILQRLEQLQSLANDLLPDFVDGTLDLQLTDPEFWQLQEAVSVGYVERGKTGSREIASIGQGIARWSAAAVQIALSLMAEDPDAMNLREFGVKGMSGRLLLVDEPEAHLHPSAVASVVRWCRRMVSYGFTVIVASHHEEFLRAAGNDLTLVQVNRDPATGKTSTRSLPSAATTRLLELAHEIGVHPASALSIHRAILFVEGPLDEAVLDEFAGLELDAAGVKIIPIHGTRNLEGLVAVELITALGIKTAVLTDATDPATMRGRSGRKRSSEERRVLRVLQIAEDRGLPAPAVFGIPEDDLIFAIPVIAIREYIGGPFPEWKELVAECRRALNKGPSDSVDWKAYAHETYGVPISTAGDVRNLVRWVDLHGTELPSIRTTVDRIVQWANTEGVG